MAYEPKLGEICIFENEKAGHENAPDHRGYFVAHRDIKAGEKIRGNSGTRFSGR
ncbi:hypothetical protein [Rhizobium grahamii]|uniref:hypothetical protein n=1 Tax=Rhizobium grahamii TaxID=1120045 RepID=UPI00031FBFA6